MKIYKKNTKWGAVYKLRSTCGYENVQLDIDVDPVTGELTDIKFPAYVSVHGINSNGDNTSPELRDVLLVLRQIMADYDVHEHKPELLQEA